jgi:hypothetical protein
MAYAGDLKSPVPNGTCGFDPHPGHFSLRLKFHQFSEHRMERFTVAWIQQFAVGDSKRFLERFPPAQI